MGQDLAHGLGEWTVDRAPAGTFVASAAETLGHVSDVQFTLAAQAYAVSPIRQLPEERRNFDAADGQNVVDQAFTIFFDGATALHLLPYYAGAGEVALSTQTAQNFAEQPNLGDGVREINAARAVRRIRTRQHQFARQSEGVIVRALTHEGTGVGHTRDVKTGRNFGGKLHA